MTYDLNGWRNWSDKSQVPDLRFRAYNTDMTHETHDLLAQFVSDIILLCLYIFFNVEREEEREEWEEIIFEKLNSQVIKHTNAATALLGLIMTNS